MVSILIETDCMEKYVTTIYLKERGLKQLRSRPIAIPSTGTSDKLTAASVSSRGENEYHDTI